MNTRNSNDVKEAEYRKFVDALTVEVNSSLSSIGYRFTAHAAEFKKGRTINYGIGLKFKDGSVFKKPVTLEEEFESYANGREDLEQISLNVISSLCVGVVKKQENPQSDLQKLFKDYSFCKRLMTIRLMPASQNQMKLKNIPHRLICNSIAAVVELRIDMYRVIVTNYLIKTWGISGEQLFRDALIWAPLKRPASLTSMFEILGGSQYLSDNGHICMYVASTEDGENGAGVILYPNFLKVSADRFDSNFFILPCSVHELIFVPEKNFTSGELANAIKEVNTTFISDDIYLFDQALHYDMKTDQLELASEYEKRVSNAC